MTTSRFVSLSFAEFAEVVARFGWTREVSAVHVHHTWRPSHTQWRGEASVEAMRRFHVEERGFSDIAQHVTIDPDGFVWTGRDWNQPPASARGFNGTTARGPFMFEMVGDFDQGRDPLGGTQRETALKVTACLLERNGLGVEAVRFHNELSPKTCPGTAVDRLAFLREAEGWRGRLPARSRGGDPGHLDEAERLIRSGPPAAEGPDAEADHGAEMRDRGPAAARDAPTPGELRLLRRHVVNSRHGRLAASGDFATEPADVRRIFEEHLPAFAAERRAAGEPVRLAFYAHGGLNGEAVGLGTALHQAEWWLANGVYPVFLVWETGLLESLAQMLSPGGAILGRGAERWGPLGEARDWAAEELARALQGVQIWSHMKLSARRGLDAEVGAASLVVDALAGFLAREPGAELHAVGHSAGAVLHAHLVPAAAVRAGAAFETLSLLAPAVRVDEFKARILPLMGGPVRRTTLFTMDRGSELDDGLFGAYGKSLLYLIHHALEPERDTPILGLEASLLADPALHEPLGLMGRISTRGGAVVWAPTTATSGPDASRATTHGGFDDDPATMNAVLRRVLGLTHEPLAMEFSGRARSPAPPVLLRDPQDYLPPALRSRLLLEGIPDMTPTTDLHPAPTPLPPRQSQSVTGRRRALCVGIDAYTSSPLQGCVADARAWAATLGGLGFETSLLLNGEASRAGILDGIERLLATSRAGDVVVVQYSGHGTHFEDLDGDEDLDGEDEALCPADMDGGAYLVDDDLADVFARIPEGVNVTLFFDCCHSGTSTRFAVGRPTAGRPIPSRRARFLRPTEAMRAAHREFRARRRSRPAGGAAVERDRNRMRQVLFAACQPDEVAWEEDGQGDFTRRALPILTSGRPWRHRELQDALVGAFGSGRRQTPHLDCADGSMDLPLFGAAEGLGRGQASPGPAAAGTPLLALAEAAEAFGAALRRHG